MTRWKERLRRILASPIMGFAPWIVFSLLEGPHRYDIATGAALAVAVLELVLGMVVGARPKLLDLSAIVFFIVMLAVGHLVGLDGRQWLDAYSGEVSNVMLVVISLASIAFKTPFTIQYAKEVAPRENWDTPLFIHINYVLTWVWTAVFAATALVGWYGDGPLHQPDNIWTNWIIQIALLIFAIRFTDWYPDVAVARAQPDAAAGTGALAALFVPLAGYLVPLGIVLLAIGGTPWWIGVGMIVAGSWLVRTLQRQSTSDGSGGGGPAPAHGDGVL